MRSGGSGWDLRGGRLGGRALSWCRCWCWCRCLCLGLGRDRRESRASRLKALFEGQQALPDLPEVDARSDYLLTVVGPELEPEAYFQMNLGGRLVFFGPTLQPDAPRLKGDLRAYSAEFPGSWIGRPAELQVSCINGSFFPAAMPVFGVHMEQVSR